MFLLSNLKNNQYINIPLLKLKFLKNIDMQIEKMRHWGNEKLIKHSLSLKILLKVKIAIKLFPLLTRHYELKKSSSFNFPIFISVLKIL